MGGAQPLAATMAGAATLCVEVDPSRIERRLETRYLDEAADSLDDALRRVRAAAAEGRALSVGLLANAADVVPELARRGEHFDLVTDQTAAHDPLTGYVPQGLDVERGRRSCVRAIPTRTSCAPGPRSPPTWRGSSSSPEPGATSSTTGTTCAARRRRQASRTRSPIPGFVPAYVRPLFCRGIGPFRWAALSGDPGDIAAIDARAGRALPRRRPPAALARARSAAGRVPGAPGAHLLARVRRPREGRARDQRARRGRAPSRRRS